MHSCGFPQEGPDAGPGSAAPLFTAASIAQSRCSAVPASGPQPDWLSPQNQSFSQGYGSVWRLPLPTLVYRLEAVHLGDLLRMWVWSGTKITLPHSDFQGPTGAHRAAQEPHCSTEPPSLCRGEPIPRTRSPYRENSSRGSHRRLRAGLRCRTGPRRADLRIRSSRFSLEYWLLPPRSAPAAAPGGLTPDTCNAHHCGPPTRRGLAPPPFVLLCQRRPGIGVTALPSSASYPEGNFGGYQLLDGSIGLLPLYPDRTIDLHVRIASDLHQFPPALSCPGIVHHLLGANVCALAPPRRRVSAWDGPLLRPLPDPCAVRDRNAAR
ncbi:hypothetical protein MTO96_025101 [Rhipicephalus appendiculatus]